jgi:hypothetical protein
MFDDVVLNHTQGNAFDYDGFGATAPFPRQLRLPVIGATSTGHHHFRSLRKQRFSTPTPRLALELTSHELFRRKGKGGRAAGELRVAVNGNSILAAWRLTVIRSGSSLRKTQIRAYQYLDRQV